MIFVSDFYRKQVLATTGWSEAFTTVIPNAIDVADLDRPKHPAARFRIGLAGYVPMIKRPDRAVDLLEGLLDHDERYQLVLRGREPWHYPWEWAKPAQRGAYETFFERIGGGGRLSRHITFEPFSPDMGSWFRGIGWMVSPSIRETFHLAPVEGMASGAVPVVWQRDGAAEIFGDDLVNADTDAAVEFVLSRSDRWADLATQMKQRVQQYDLLEVRELWFQLVSLGKGDQVPTNGTPLVADDAPGSAGAVAALVDEGLRRGRLDEVGRALTEHSDVLSDAIGGAQVRDRVAGAEVIATWAEDPSRILPPVGLSPALVADQSVVVGVDADLAGQWVAPADDVHCAPGTRLDHQVHLLADAVQRTVRRVRAASVVAPDQPGPKALAAAVAARRLGLPLIWQPREAEGQLDLPQAWRGLHEAARADPAAGGQGRSLAALRVGVLADEFTRRTLAATLPVVELRRRSWREQLDGLDAVIIESAWEGRDKEWFHGVAYHGEQQAADLVALLQECRSRGIPSLFWNKEDPVHFRSFQQAASWCDHVFTTDADVLPRYLHTEATRATTFSALPFYAQPAMHHRKPGARAPERTIAFAGSYYGDRYKARSAELRMILEEAAPHGLTIYDRQHDRPDSPYQLPADLLKYSVGSLSYAEMADAYKAHPVHINVNSVNDSPSMFSRRVVEIAASGSLVLSGAGRGVSAVLGDAFPVLTSREQWREMFARVMGDEQLRQQMAEAQYQTVMRAHRANQAVAIMLRTAGLAVEVDTDW